MCVYECEGVVFGEVGGRMAVVSGWLVPLENSPPSLDGEQHP